MNPPELIRVSLRRSYVRSRIVHILLQRGTLLGGDLVDFAGIDWRRLRWALHGEQGLYKARYGLVRLRLIEEVKVRGEVAYRLTPLGRVEGRILMRERRSRDWS